MDNTLFINNSINEAFLLYNEVKDKKNSLNYNGFLCSIVRMLKLIYGDDLLKCYDNKDISGFDTLIMKYGFDSSDYNNFKISVEKYYNFDKKIADKTIKKKNKFFNLVQKYLIDMMVKRKNQDNVDEEIIKEFYELLFTANSKDFYRKSVAVLEAYNPYEIDEYAKKQSIYVG